MMYSEDWRGIYSFQRCGTITVLCPCSRLLRSTSSGGSQQHFAQILRDGYICSVKYKVIRLYEELPHVKSCQRIECTRGRRHPSCEWKTKSHHSLHYSPSCKSVVWIWCVLTIFTFSILNFELQASFDLRILLLFTRGIVNSSVELGCEWFNDHVCKSINCHDLFKMSRFLPHFNIQRSRIHGQHLGCDLQHPLRFTAAPPSWATVRECKGFIGYLKASVRLELLSDRLARN